MSTSTNPITSALINLVLSMPRQILELTFFPNREHQTTDATNLAQRIREMVIDPIVMNAMNNNGGVGIEIDINPSWTESIDPSLVIAKVPKNVTQNRRITSVLNASFGVNMVTNAAVTMANQGNQYLMGANRVFMSSKPPPLIGTPDVVVRGNNVLEIRNFVSLPVRVRALVRLAYSQDFTELRPQYWTAFEELCEVAIKAYVYNNLLVPMDRAEMVGGIEMGRFSSKVEEWSDAHETYKDMLREQWRRILILNDPLLSKRHVTKIVNP